MVNTKHNTGARQSSNICFSVPTVSHTDDNDDDYDDNDGDYDDKDNHGQAHTHDHDYAEDAKDDHNDCDKSQLTLSSAFNNTWNTMKRMMKHMI